MSSTNGRDNGTTWPPQADDNDDAAARSGDSAAPDHTAAAFHHETAAHHHRMAAAKRRDGDHYEADRHGGAASGHARAADGYVQPRGQGGGEPQTGGYGADEDDDRAKRGGTNGGMNGGFQRSPSGQAGLMGQDLDGGPGRSGGTTNTRGAADAGMRRGRSSRP